MPCNFILAISWHENKGTTKCHCCLPQVNCCSLKKQIKFVTSTSCSVATIYDFMPIELCTVDNKTVIFLLSASTTVSNKEEEPASQPFSAAHLVTK
jgi:hypothetical protein